MELTDTELALRWWHRKSDYEKSEVAKLADFQRNDIGVLTVSEIEWIWRNQPYNF